MTAHAVFAVPEGFTTLAIFSIVASCTLSYLVTDLSVRLSLRRGRLDVPNERSLHAEPVPRLGGVGIVVGFIVPAAVLWGINAIDGGREWIARGAILVFILTAVIMGGAGLYDDLHVLTALQKFTIQGVFALVIAAYGLRFAEPTFEFSAFLPAGALWAFLTMLWLVAFTNFFNFMDGINGMAGFSAVIYGSFLACFAWQMSQFSIATVAILSVGASLGFLFHNFPHARTFMGDAGSLFLGMFFALLACLLYGAGGSRIFVPLLLLFSPYLYDCTFTLLRRVVSRENIFRAHRSHLYQRLIKRGWTHPQVTFLYASLHILGGCLGMAYLHFPNVSFVATGGLMAAALVALTLFVCWSERRHAPFTAAAEPGSATIR